MPKRSPVLPAQPFTFTVTDRQLWLIRDAVSRVEEATRHTAGCADNTLNDAARASMLSVADECAAICSLCDEGAQCYSARILQSGRDRGQRR